jgi:hypothetical protein
VMMKHAQFDAVEVQKHARDVRVRVGGVERSLEDAFRHAASLSLASAKVSNQEAKARWRLGKFLHELRAAMPRGYKWEVLLKAYGVHRATAFKCMKIADAFASEAAIGDLRLRQVELKAGVRKADVRSHGSAETADGCAPMGAQAGGGVAVGAVGKQLGMDGLYTRAEQLRTRLLSLVDAARKGDKNAVNLLESISQRLADVLQ